MQYMHFYRKFMMDSWDNITPRQFGVMVVAIAVMGYVLMKAGSK